MSINYLNKAIVSIWCAIASMCVDAKGSEENSVSNGTTPLMKTANMQLIEHSRNGIKDNMLNTSSSLSIALDQLVYSPLRNTKTFITSFGKFAYENPAMAAITTTYFMLPIVAAYANTEGPYWSAQYCCTKRSDIIGDCTPQGWTAKCSTAPAIVGYTSGFPGFLDKNSCMYNTQSNFNSIYEPSITACYADSACTQENDICTYIPAFVNNNTYGTPCQASCVPHS